MSLPSKRFLKSLEVFEKELVGLVLPTPSTTKESKSIATAHTEEFTGDGIVHIAPSKAQLVKAYRAASPLIDTLGRKYYLVTHYRGGIISSISPEWDSKAVEVYNDHLSTSKNKSVHMYWVAFPSKRSARKRTGNDDDDDNGDCMDISPGSLINIDQGIEMKLEMMVIDVLYRHEIGSRGTGYIFMCPSPKGKKREPHAANYVKRWGATPPTGAFMVNYVPFDV